ncbi:hypothetical protein GCM10023081_01630 [Arthrobacter ginkgonis]|uniref:Uncharacterized protein n=1 Tax=Arthrobacter ginkgonis TaxID=1630594 RepID=A0ABP7BS40_9MICC
MGLAVWLVPGRGGRNTATTEPLAPPQKIATLPSPAGDRPDREYTAQLTSPIVRDDNKDSPTRPSE